MYFQRQYVKYTLEDMEERYALLESGLQLTEKQIHKAINDYEKGIQMGQILAIQTELLFLKRTMKFLKGALE